MKDVFIIVMLGLLIVNGALLIWANILSIRNGYLIRKGIKKEKYER